MTSGDYRCAFQAFRDAPSPNSITSQQSEHHHQKVGIRLLQDLAEDAKSRPQCAHKSAQNATRGPLGPIWASIPSVRRPTIHHRRHAKRGLPTSVPFRKSTLTIHRQTISTPSKAQTASPKCIIQARLHHMPGSCHFHTAHAFGSVSAKDS